MYRYSQQMQAQRGNLRLRLLIISVLLALALIACVVLGLSLHRANTFRNDTRQQLNSRLRSVCVETHTLAERLTSSVNANTPAALANIRQGIYAMEQLNAAAIVLFGEGGRIVPEEALTALYEDMDSYFSIIQTNTVSVLETRTLLINHLAALQAYLTQ